MLQALIQKYNVPGPRYTSYPTVPYWDDKSFDVARWRETLVRSFRETNASAGLSLYVHLPYCESLCTFCGCNKRITRNHEVEAPYIRHLQREWALYREIFPGQPRIRELHLGGGTPTFFSPAHLCELVSALCGDTQRADDAEFGFEANPNVTRPEHLKALYEAGFRRLSLGVQDFDPEVQTTINRVQPYERVEEVTLKAREIGYRSINFDLVYGLPRQRLAGVEDTIAKVLTLRPDRIAFYSYAHVPWIKGVGQRKFSESDLPKDAEKRALYETGRALLEAAGYHEIGMDHFALPGDSLYLAATTGRLHRNFMGYTPVHTQLSVGLGVSAIGDSWYGFAQNEKKIEQYTARLDAGELPVFRGHLLDPEDLRLRRHILNIMCRFRTSWDTDSSLDPVFEQGLERLAEMEADGLVARGTGHLDVLPAGHAFIRNICMALDARLWRDEPTTRIFSQVI
jgi:oxygen-independent coproporphyrinogen III oxidase